MHLRLRSAAHSGTETRLAETNPSPRLKTKTDGDMASRLAALLLLCSVVCAELAAAEVPVDCCKKASDSFLPKKILKAYRIQEAGQGCDISATIFVTKGGKSLCVVHPDEQGWVRNHIVFLDNKKKAQK